MYNVQVIHVHEWIHHVQKLWGGGGNKNILISSSRREKPNKIKCVPKTFILT